MIDIFMITFQQFMENLKELGPYGSGPTRADNHVQALAALDKHEEGDATFQEIEAWVKGGIIQILQKIDKFFRDHQNWATSGVVGREIFVVLRMLNAEKATAFTGRDPQKTASSELAAVYYKIKKLPRLLRAIIPYQLDDNEPPAEVEEQRREYKSLIDQFVSIVSTHVRSPGTKDLVSRLTDAKARLKAFAKKKVVRDSTPKIIMNAVDKLVTKI